MGGRQAGPHEQGPQSWESSQPPAQHEHQQQHALVTWNLPYVTDCPATQRSTASSQRLFWVRAGRQSNLLNY